MSGMDGRGSIGRSCANYNATMRARCLRVFHRVNSKQPDCEKFKRRFGLRNDFDWVA